MRTHCGAGRDAPAPAAAPRERAAGLPGQRGPAGVRARAAVTAAPRTCVRVARPCRTSWVRCLSSRASREARSGPIASVALQKQAIARSQTYGLHQPVTASTPLCRPLLKRLAGPWHMRAVIRHMADYYRCRVMFAYIGLYVYATQILTRQIASQTPGSA